ncbi:unnamed protein product [Closterium sp. NIES-65]|nr:unnamed protein product [Closterium sp. NIES-65]
MKRTIYEDPTAVYFVMEKCSGGDLLSYISRKGQVPEDEAAKIFRQLVTAVAFCHEHGVVHRDLKPENVLITHQQQVKLTDFGQAVPCRREGFVQGAAGSLPYTAPELLCRLKYNEKVDVWSLGVILYTMLAGKWPFYSPKKGIMKRMICGAQLDLVSEPWHLISAEALHMVKKLLTVNPSQRPSCKELLQHPWLR